MKSFDLVTLCNLVTVFAETKSVTKSRLHSILCKGTSMYYVIILNFKNSIKPSERTTFGPFVIMLKDEKQFSLGWIKILTKL